MKSFKRSLWLLTISLCIWSQVNLHAASSVTTKIASGELQGTKTGEVTSYKGIPFAAPPIGPLRWKNPEPVKPWQGIRKATEFAPGPMQNGLIAFFMGIPRNFSEDCLYLNVWTPATNSNQKLPVMVWIYGGAFAMGSTSQPLYDGTRLAERGVVFVSVAYRVGAFGFLAHPALTKEGGKGNFGLRDQIAGLEWVRDNIAAFGGDPKNVTIFGESAGAQSVNLLVTSPKTAGLFQRVIAESGVLIAPPQRTNELGLQTRPLDVAERNGVKFLSELKVKTLAEARSLSADKIQKVKFEGSPVYDDDLIPSDPVALYQRKGFNDTSVLVGYNSDDGGFFAGGNKRPEEFVAAFQGLGQFAKPALEFYPHKDKKEATRSAKEFVKDAYFGWPTWKWATLHAQYGSSKPFVYYFDYRTEKTPEGVPHGAEMGYVFGTQEKPKPQDIEFSNQMMSYWVNFAKTGNPNGNGLPQWDAFAPTEPKVMILDKKSRMESWPDLKRIEALDPYFEWQRKVQHPATTVK